MSESSDGPVPSSPSINPSPFHEISYSFPRYRQCNTPGLLVSMDGGDCLLSDGSPARFSFLLPCAHIFRCWSRYRPWSSKIGVETGIEIESGTGTGPGSGTRIDIENMTVIAIKIDRQGVKSRLVLGLGFRKPSGLELTPTSTTVKDESIYYAFTQDGVGHKTVAARASTPIRRNARADSIEFAVCPGLRVPNEITYIRDRNPSRSTEVTC
ncbi:hypothetical protein EVAR_57554_1 [Eumeta japonica]|uniref:Uncharacterized protein n=1 Tax=Eumeta variegata TaxID=151549 RepID=A0A4C1Y428_EUMVA|nr:hypothetical protein EVAR_57554_1 [Eumeta japonica]